MAERNYWQRMRRRQMSRRALLGASARAGVGAAGLALVGCGDDDDSAADAQAQVLDQQDDTQGDQQQVVTSTGPKRGGVLRQSTPAATHDYFDPHRGVFGPTQNWMGFYMNYLIRYRNKEDGVLESDIASLPEQPDGETYVFSIDQGARFWDQYPTEGGREVTAEDIRLNFQRQIDATDASGAEDGTYLGASSFQKTSSMEVPDDSTFIARTDGPDATWLGVPLRPFSWITSPEAIAEFGDRWRDEAANVELASGTGMFIPQSYDADIGIDMIKNVNYWKMGADGQPLPYYDEVVFSNLTDATAVEAAYRGKQIYIGGFPLSSVQGEEILSDFPEHGSGQIAFGFTIITGGANYNPDWDGEDGLGNPFRDRRFSQAMHLAVDPYLMIDAVYLKSGRPSGMGETPWYNAFWAIPEEELIETPGYRPNRDADIAEARALLDASGYDLGRGITLIAPDLWEATYPGILETEVSMYRGALDLEVSFDVQPYSVVLQRWVEGTYPGQGPQWTNPPSDLDPTTSYNNNYVPGGSTNNLFYDYPRMTEIAETMKVTLDLEERQALAHEAQRILLGTHPDHGLDGLANSPAVMNGISPAVWWPFVHRGEDTLQFAHASHRHDDTWIDTDHPEYPA